MMKRVTLVALGLALALGLSSSLSFAQDTSSVVVPKALLTAEQLAKVSQSGADHAIQTADKVVEIGKATGWGKEIGEGVNGALSALTTNADRFARTGVGKFTMWMVAFKVLGSQAIRLFMALLVMISLTGIFIWIQARDFMPHRYLAEESIIDGKTIKKYAMHPSDVDQQRNEGALSIRDERTIYVVVYVAIMIILLFIGGC